MSHLNGNHLVCTRGYAAPSPWRFTFRQPPQGAERYPSSQEALKNTLDVLPTMEDLIGDVERIADNVDKQLTSIEQFYNALQDLRDPAAERLKISRYYIGPQDRESFRALGMPPRLIETITTLVSGVSAMRQQVERFDTTSPDVIAALMASVRRINESLNVSQQELFGYATNDPLTPDFVPDVMDSVELSSVGQTLGSAPLVEVPEVNNARHQEQMQTRPSDNKKLQEMLAIMLNPSAPLGMEIVLGIVESTDHADVLEVVRKTPSGLMKVLVQQEKDRETGEYKLDAQNRRIAKDIISLPYGGPDDKDFATNKDPNQFPARFYGEMLPKSVQNAAPDVAEVIANLPSHVEWLRSDESLPGASVVIGEVESTPDHIVYESLMKNIDGRIDHVLVKRPVPAEGQPILDAQNRPFQDVIASFPYRQDGNLDTIFSTRTDTHIFPLRLPGREAMQQSVAIGEVEKQAQSIMRMAAGAGKNNEYYQRASAQIASLVKRYNIPLWTVEMTTSDGIHRYVRIANGRIEEGVVNASNSHKQYVAKNTMRLDSLGKNA